MSLHMIFEPAGALQTGWKLVPKDSEIAKAESAPQTEVDEEIPRVPHEDLCADPRSAWEMREVR